MGRLGDALRQDLQTQAVRIAQTVTADITNDLRRTAPVVTGDLYTQHPRPLSGVHRQGDHGLHRHGTLRRIRRRRDEAASDPSSQRPRLVVLLAEGRRTGVLQIRAASGHEGRIRSGPTCSTRRPGISKPPSDACRLSSCLIYTPTSSKPPPSSKTPSTSTRSAPAPSPPSSSPPDNPPPVDRRLLTDRRMARTGPRRRRPADVRTDLRPRLCHPSGRGDRHPSRHLLHGPGGERRHSGGHHGGGGGVSGGSGGCRVLRSGRGEDGWHVRGVCGCDRGHVQYDAEAGWLGGFGGVVDG